MWAVFCLHFSYRIGHNCIAMGNSGLSLPIQIEQIYGCTFQNVCFRKLVSVFFCSNFFSAWTCINDFYQIFVALWKKRCRCNADSHSETQPFQHLALDIHRMVKIRFELLLVLNQRLPRLLLMPSDHKHSMSRWPGRSRPKETLLWLRPHSLGAEQVAVLLEAHNSKTTSVDFIRKTNARCPRPC